MSPAKLSEDGLAAVIAFHGHDCPGLALGIRAAEVALEQIGPHAADEEVVCVTETDMCAVDAIQFLTGCTLGKGNLILRDHGKIAFSFWRRSDGKAVRILLRPPAEDDPEGRALRRKRATIGLSAEDQALVAERRAARIQQILAATPEDLFDIQPLEAKPPLRARLMDSLICERCGESTMESRTRRFLGQVVCGPCFEHLDRRT